MYSYIVLMLSVFRIVNSQLVCPEHKPLENFDIDFYTSQYWYEIEKYDNGWEEDQYCLSVSFDTSSDVNTFNITGVKDGQMFYNSGPMAAAENIGTMNFYSNQYLDAIGTDFIQVNVTYMSSRVAVVHHCVVTQNGLQEFAWILTTKSTLSDETKQEIDQYFSTVNTFDRSKFEPVNHKDCYNYS